MRLMLKIQSEDSTVPPVWLSPGQTLTVGRTDAANLAVPHDLLLSRVHFKIVVESGACCVCDLNSSNGTFLHGERITEAQLVDGDQIHAGETVFAVSIELGSTIAEKVQAQLGGVTAGGDISISSQPTAITSAQRDSAIGQSCPAVVARQLLQARLAATGGTSAGLSFRLDPNANRHAVVTGLCVVGDADRRDVAAD